MIPKAGEFYRHFKGGLYEVIGVATEEDCGYLYVFYKGADDKLWCRTIYNWRMIVTLKREDGTTSRVPRFERVEKMEEAESEQPVGS